MISGWLKTSEWAIAALIKSGNTHALSFSATGFSMAQARFTVERSVGSEMSAVQRSGPGDAAASGRTQCLFIHYYKVKHRQLRPWVKKIVAAAEPQDPGYNEDDETIAAGKLIGTPGPRPLYLDSHFVKHL